MKRRILAFIAIFLVIFLNSGFCAERQLEFSYSPNWLYKFKAKALLSIDKNGKARLSIIDVFPAFPQAYIWMKFYPRIDEVYWYNKCIYVSFKIKFQGKGRAAEIPFDSMNDPSTYKWKGPQKGLHEGEWSENSVEGKPYFCINEFPELAGIKQFQIANQAPNAFSFHANGNIKPEDIGTYQDWTYITGVRGNVYVYRIKTHKWVKVKKRLRLYVGDIVKVSSGRARVLIKGRVSLRVRPHTMFQIPKVKENRETISFIKLTYGVLTARLKKERECNFKVYIPQAITGVRGTRFEVSYDKKNKIACVKTFEHSVWFSDIKKRKTVIVNEGMESCVFGNGLPTEPKPMKPFNIKGKWKTDFGVVVFRQDGDRVLGTYPHDKGKIEGKLIGNILICKWREAPTYKPKRDAGDCKFRFSPDGNSFEGKWRYGFGYDSWDGKWNGERMR
ncbi:FecR family protein [Hippea sp. KM1]|uniref:FecR family protein n=1 Tax=Hippea sp. KM1 TaxID=944481 RepID=UPI00046CA0E1|nr:FecR family protein [Hippea sp. KM1]